MSQTEVLRFQEYLKGHPELLAELGNGRMSHALAVASDHGFKVTLSDLTAFVKARAARSGRALTDAQLENMAGGANCVPRAGGGEPEHCCLRELQP
ncbi:MAG: hypothetical protein EPO67_22940 [Reyranella sp.]|nr:MAG: hypothetical protein EPO67_22940 [Reyranella sp.]